MDSNQDNQHSEKTATPDDQGTSPQLNRRSFLKLAGGTGLSLSLMHFDNAWSKDYVAKVVAGEERIQYDSWQSIYRDIWTWDKVYWGSHTNQCAPGGCSFRVYTKNGVVWREEQSAHSYASNANYPDYNPQGCQKGCSFHFSLSSPERVKYPLRRVGERGEGKWERIGWDEALEAIADSILDCHEAFGPESFVIDSPHIHAGSVAFTGAIRMGTMLGALTPDLTVNIGDDLKGIGQTFGKMEIGYTADNFFDAELIIITHSNFAYSWTSSYHFVSEARYNGTEVVVIAPEFNATALTADIHIPLKVASDAAFWLAISQVIIEEGLQNEDFMREQTDLPLLVRKDSGHYLRASDVDGGKEDQFYFYDEESANIVAAPRGTLAFTGRQALGGTYTATLLDGSSVDVTPVFEQLKKKLNSQHTPEMAADICGAHASVIRTMARKVAAKRTCNYIGFSSGKHYHGDLMERSLLLAMALSGNWGKPGTGFNCFLVPDTGYGFLALMHPLTSEWNDWTISTNLIRGLRSVTSLLDKFKDPDETDEQLALKFLKKTSKLRGQVPPMWLLYNHAGYKDLWNKPEWSDPDLPRSFVDYVEQSLERDYWDEQEATPSPEQTPQVMMIMANNPLRRQRSGRSMYVENLFPKLKMLFAIETRMSSSAAFCDIVLPAAWYYEKEDMTMTFGMNPYTALIQKAVEPPGECKPEWEIFERLLSKIEERASARKLKGFKNRIGNLQRYKSLHKRFTMNGMLHSQEDALKKLVQVSEAIGTFPKGFTYEEFERLGQVRVHGLGDMGNRMDLINAADVDPSKPFYSLAWHIDRKKPYPTVSRRAQFYIEHEWFLEANEALPTHKETPPIGGTYPFRIISGHSRSTINSIHSASAPLMRLHRGQPLLYMNRNKAREMGIEDGDTVKMFNDYDDSQMMVATTAGLASDQIFVSMWEPFQFKDWKSPDGMLIGQPKALHLAGDYEQLKARVYTGSPTPTSDRGLRVGIVKVEASGHEAGNT